MKVLTEAHIRLDVGRREIPPAALGKADWRLREDEDSGGFW